MARPSRKEEGRVEILEAAAGVIAQRGFHGMSMRELAKELGKTPAVFYNYYASKEDLLFDLQRRAFETLVQSAKDAIEKATSPIERLYAFLFQHVRYVAENRAVMQILVQEAHALPPKERKAIRAVKDEYYAVGRDVIRSVLEQSACTPGAPGRRGPARSIDAGELERQTYAVFGMLNWTYGWYRPKEHGGPEELTHTLHRMLMCGLRPECPIHAKNGNVEAITACLRGTATVPLLRIIPDHPTEER